ncbi:hypothetical protein [Dictyobacter arantiisoli]|uniref:Uncharacterized protein n=1 Tax=Dictyobacter arantiisoli TaxID=2014874 RepID=A0A5A5T748_9CHLR|nr:hypothetical protein [Dictyobacter arantiisoli]GCF07016.1 hypothetical protein KDI_05800 [Dictyobacter arantiisoli]
MNFFEQWWDILLFILFSSILTFINIPLWRARKSIPSLQDLPQKQSGASILASANSAAVSAVSVLISASLVFIQLELKLKNNVRHDVLDHTFRAVLWFLFSLFIGLILTWMNGTHSQFKNIAASIYISLLFGFQLLAIVIGVGRILLGVYTAIYR